MLTSRAEPVTGWLVNKSVAVKPIFLSSCTDWLAEAAEGLMLILKVRVRGLVNRPVLAGKVPKFQISLLVEESYWTLASSLGRVLAWMKVAPGMEAVSTPLVKSLLELVRDKLLKWEADGKP